MSTWFCSGSETPAIFRGFARAGADVGIDVTSSSPSILEMAASYTRAGGRVFVDSGAFGAFRRRLAKTSVRKNRPATVDFDLVFDRYNRLVADGRAAGLHLVMPDCIGDQAASLSLLRKYADDVRDFIAAGVVCLVPLQRGELTLPALHDAVTEIVGPGWVPALPSNEAAITAAEAVAYVADVRPRRLHLLGIGQSTPAKRARVAELIDAAGGRLVVTTDSNRHRAHVGQGRQITARRADYVDDGYDGPVATERAIADWYSSVAVAAVA
jgi:hypothetical protein